MPRAKAAESKEKIDGVPGEPAENKGNDVIHH
jgi:hypothetical protein